MGCCCRSGECNGSKSRGSEGGVVADVEMLETDITELVTGVETAMVQSLQEQACCSRGDRTGYNETAASRYAIQDDVRYTRLDKGT